MDDRPSLIERQALGNLIKVLESKSSELKGYFSNDFKEWNPIYDSGITGQRYYHTLREFPLYAKRCIIQSTLLGWNYHHDLRALYETLNTLIYLKLCGPAEYLFIQIIYNFIASYGDILNDYEYIEVESYEVNRYTLRFWKDDSIMRDTYGIIIFELHDSKKEPSLAVVPWNSLLRNVYDLHDTGDDFDALSKEDIDEITMRIGNIFKDEWALRHCPWIQSSWECGVGKEPLDRGIVFILKSIKYLDPNGCFDFKD